MASWKERIWATIVDASSARLAVDRGVRFTTIWAIVSLAIGVISLLSGKHVFERNPVEAQGAVFDTGGQAISSVVFVITGLVFALIAWKIRNMSKGWTLAGLIVSGLTLISDFAASPSLLALVCHLLILFAFVNAVRGVFVFERIERSVSDVKTGPPYRG